MGLYSSYSSSVQSTDRVTHHVTTDVPLLSSATGYIKFTEWELCYKEMQLPLCEIGLDLMLLLSLNFYSFLGPGAAPWWWKVTTVWKRSFFSSFCSLLHQLLFMASRCSAELISSTQAWSVLYSPQSALTLLFLSPCCDLQNCLYLETIKTGLALRVPLGLGLVSPVSSEGVEKTLSTDSIESTCVIYDVLQRVLELNRCSTPTVLDPLLLQFALVVISSVFAGRNRLIFSKVGCFIDTSDLFFCKAAKTWPKMQVWWGQMHQYSLSIS